MRVNAGIVNKCTLTSCTIVQTSDNVTGFLCDINKGRIAGCLVENCAIAASGTSAAYIGGLVVDNNKEGVLSDSAVKNSSVSVTNIAWYGVDVYIGGLVRWNGGTMTNCSGQDVTLGGSSAGVCDTNMAL